MRVLSVQSWVSHGYVGNKVSVFALQVWGYEVDPINSVNLSNHTGYPVFRGDVLTGEQLWTIFDGLMQSGLLDGYTHLLTGARRRRRPSHELLGHSPPTLPRIDRLHWLALLPRTHCRDAPRAQRAQSGAALCLRSGALLCAGCEPG